MNTTSPTLIKICNLLFFVLICSAIDAQTTIINYERKADIEYQLRNVKDPATRARVTTTLSKPIFFRLTNAKDFSSFTKTNDNGLSNNLDIINESVSNQTFKDLKLNMYLKESVLDGNKYIIKDTLSMDNWNIHDESKSVAGYNCKKVTTEVNGEIITAWVTQDLKINDGPDIYGIEGGTILELKLKAVSYVATDVLIHKKEVELSKPEKGRIISPEEYDKKLSKLKSRFIFPK